jgi:hypothetical protein
MAVRRRTSIIAKTKHFRFLKANTNSPSPENHSLPGRAQRSFAPRGIPHTYRYRGTTPGRLMCTITPSGFEGFFEKIGALSPQQQQDIPRVMEIAKEFGLEILPPSGA